MAGIGIGQGSPTLPPRSAGAVRARQAPSQIQLNISDAEALDAADRALGRSLMQRRLTPPGDSRDWQATAAFASASSFQLALEGKVTGPGLGEYTDAQLVEASSTTVMNAGNISLVSSLAAFTSALVNRGDADTINQALQGFLTTLSNDPSGGGDPTKPPGTIQQIDKKIASNGAQIDELIEMGGRIQHLDPAKARALFNAADQLEFENLILAKEKEKHEELHRFINLLLIGGFIPKGLIDKLKAMGLGYIVDQVIATLLPKGRLSRQVVESLKEAGYGSLTFVDDERIKEVDHLRDGTDAAGRQNTAGSRSGLQGERVAISRNLQSARSGRTHAAAAGASVGTGPESRLPAGLADGVTAASMDRLLTLSASAGAG